jgi:hypothetical protein
MTKKDGGPAFPRAGFSGPMGYGKPENGMTLRDWIAGQVIAGRMLNGFASSADAEVHARVAYKIADAMIAEREK